MNKNKLSRREEFKQNLQMMSMQQMKLEMLNDMRNSNTYMQMDSALFDKFVISKAHETKRLDSSKQSDFDVLGVKELGTEKLENSALLNNKESIAFLMQPLSKKKPKPINPYMINSPAPKKLDLHQISFNSKLDDS